MDKESLTQILAIPDAKKRIKELSSLAQTLRIKLDKVRGPDGEIRENKLTVLIYDVLSRQTRQSRQNMILIIASVVFFILAVGGMFAVIRVMRQLTGQGG